MKNKEVKVVRILSLLVSSLLACIYQPAFAQTNNVGLSLGIGSMIVDASEDDTNVSWTGAIEYERRFCPSLALKLSGHMGNATSVKTRDIGKATESERDVEYKAVSVSAVGYYPLVRNQELYLAGGINANKVKMKPKSGSSTDNDGLGYTIQAGWQYHFNKSVAMHVGVQRLGLKDVDINTADIGVSFSF